MAQVCRVLKLGLIDYEKAWQLQEGYAAEIARGERPPTLLLLEHPHTYTFGRGGHPENLLWDEAELVQRGVQVYWVDRGGDVTYHGPGQLVGYPLLPLAPGGLYAHSDGRLPQADYVGYLRKLETMLIDALAGLGVSAEQAPGLTGVWIKSKISARRLEGQLQKDIKTGERRNQPSTSPSKIAAIGVKVDVHGVSRHGFALNVDADMEYWKGIIGCGLKGYASISLADLLDPVPDMDQVMAAVIQAFGETFGFEMRPEWTEE
jgi:lipoyl(octanoyl) transferase